MKRKEELGDVWRMECRKRILGQYQNCIIVHIDEMELSYHSM